MNGPSGNHLCLARGKTIALAKVENGLAIGGQDMSQCEVARMSGPVAVPVRGSSLIEQSAQRANKGAINKN